MRYALTLLSILTVTCVLSAAEPTYVLSNGKVAVLTPTPNFTATVTAPPSGACYVDAFGRTVCPSARPSVSYYAPTATVVSSTGASLPCPCVAANGSCLCATGASLPMPMAGAGWSYSVAQQDYLPMYLAHPIQTLMERKPVRTFFRNLFGR